MVSRKRMVLATCISLILLCGALFSVWIDYLENERSEPYRDQIEVVKAARNLRVGTILTKDKITTEQVPERFLPPNPLLEEDLNLYLGQPIYVKVDEGAMIVTSTFARSKLTPTMEEVGVVTFQRKVFAGEVLRQTDVDQEILLLPKELSESLVDEVDYTDLIGKPLLVDKIEGDVLLPTEVCLDGDGDCEIVPAHSREPGW